MKGQHVTLQPRWLYSVMDERSYIVINFKYTTDEFNVFFSSWGIVYILVNDIARTCQLHSRIMAMLATQINGSHYSTLAWHIPLSLS